VFAIYSKFQATFNRNTLLSQKFVITHFFNKMAMNEKVHNPQKMKKGIIVDNEND